MKTEEKKKKSGVKRFCQRFQIGVRRVTSYENVKHRLGYRFYSDEQLKARENYDPNDTIFF